jgi:hypothetical protein
MATGLRTGGFALALLALPVAALAQNLAANGEFDDDTSSWIHSPTEATLTWAAIDHSGCSAAISGAAEARNLAAEAATFSGYGVCIPGIEPGGFYSFGASFRFPPGQLRTGFAELRIFYFNSEDCSGLVRGNGVLADLSPDTGTAGNWVAVRNDLIQAGSERNSAMLVAWLTKNEAGGELRVQIDGAWVADATGFLFGDGFERASTCRW